MFSAALAARGSMVKTFPDLPRLRISHTKGEPSERSYAQKTQKDGDALKKPQAIQVPCMFLCQCIINKSPDPIDSSKVITGEYPDGSGTADWFCASIYRSRYKRTYTRAELVQAMRDDKHVLDEFLRLRQVKIQKAKEQVSKGRPHPGQGGASKRPSTRFEEDKVYKEALLPPAPDLLPEKEYFETVSKTVQKK